MKLTTAMFFYASCAFMLYAAYNAPEWDALNHGWPQTSREWTVALLIINAMGAKLLGHVFLLSTTRAR